MKKNIYIAFFITLCMQSVYASDNKTSYYRNLPQDNRTAYQQEKQSLQKLVQVGQEAQEFQDRRSTLRCTQLGLLVASSVCIGFSSKEDDIFSGLGVLSLFGTIGISFSRIFPWKDSVDERLAAEVIAGKQAQERLNSSNRRN